VSFYLIVGSVTGSAVQFAEQDGAWIDAGQRAGESSCGDASGLELGSGGGEGEADGQEGQG